MDGIYLAISLTTSCNLKCFYCKPTGESISNQNGTITFSDFCRITASAYNCGIKKFRFTGGECTIVPYLKEAIIFIMSLGSDTRINICSNGFNLLEYINVIEKYKERIHVRISVDSFSEYLNGFHFPKYLSSEICALAKQLVERGIETRFNIVVTSYNIDEIQEMILSALNLGVNIKLLDLYVQDVYLGGKGNSNSFWVNTYQSLTGLRGFLDSICDLYIPNYWSDSAFGIPMGAYFYHNQSIILKDSSKGAHFSKYCIEQCSLYSTCQEGVYVPFLSVGNILHINGCHNPNLQWDLTGLSAKETNQAILELLSNFNTLEVKLASSEQFRHHMTFKNVQDLSDES